MGSWKCPLAVSAQKIHLTIFRDGEQEDLIMEILCLFKVSAALPRLLELYQRYPDIWRRMLLRYGWYFKDKSILPYIEPYLTCDDKEYRSMAKKAKEKLSIIK